MVKSNEQDQNRSAQHPETRPQADQTNPGTDTQRQAGNGDGRTQQGGTDSAPQIRDWASI